MALHTCDIADIAGDIAGNTNLMITLRQPLYLYVLGVQIGITQRTDYDLLVIVLNYFFIDLYHRTRIRCRAVNALES